MVIEMDDPSGTVYRVPTNIVKRASRAQENKIARSVGGRRQKASGSLPWAKGDVHVPGKYRGEARQTTKGSYTIKRSDLIKIWSEASGTEVPFLEIWFTDERHKPQEKWVLIPESEWRRLRDATTINK
jgi:hypothetical protein